MIKRLRGLLKAFLIDSSGNELVVDDTTRVLGNIDYAHHEIHEGSMFRVQAYDDAIAAAATLIIGFNVSNQSKKPHFVFEWETESIGNIQLIEDTAIDVSTGTDILIKNSRRDSANTSILQGYATGAWVSNYITKNPTYVGGNLISLKKIYSNAKAGGGEGSRRSEIILKVNTEYVLIFTNTDTSAKGAQMRLEWYEHTDL